MADTNRPEMGREVGMCVLNAIFAENLRLVSAFGSRNDAKHSACDARLPERTLGSLTATQASAIRNGCPKIK